MIHVEVESRIIIVRGARSMAAIEKAVLDATGRSQWRFRGTWTIVGLADDVSHGITTGMPFSPPDADRPSVGFKRNAQ